MYVCVFRDREKKFHPRIIIDSIPPLYYLEPIMITANTLCIQ